MKNIVEKVLDTVTRDPLPVLMMGAGAGLVLLSLYDKKADAGEQTSDIDPVATDLGGEPATAEETANSAREKALDKLSLGLSALMVSAAISGVLPGIGSEKVEEWKSDLLAKAGEAGEQLLRNTEQMLREKFNLELENDIEVSETSPE